ncbi:excinuclease ABC subunit UvrA [Nannocystis bainbridge]|uniref:UvrABC system protein A n=1 Tax=Nannocystis bainbridge TaxID=2995303 RepID=A0ABT5DXR7_9BACT|nr:excinuclease ABC subunit UvrA [Nannocystis bainbridge]MDC0718403.1 excinuclease ABC subunit UvrA [Nannocystis bainbridge]
MSQVSKTRKSAAPAPAAAPAAKAAKTSAAAATASSKTKAATATTSSKAATTAAAPATTSKAAKTSTAAADTPVMAPATTAKVAKTSTTSTAASSKTSKPATASTEADAKASKPATTPTDAKASKPATTPTDVMATTSSDAPASAPSSKPATSDAPASATAASDTTSTAPEPALAPARPAIPVPPNSIRIRGARTHNLQGVDLDLPRGKLVVLTGPSGSGKSSLAFHTIFAEGQRRYVESLSASARQFLAQLPKPDVDLIEGLSPSIAIEQSSPGKNPRSTVGTSTEVYDFLRLLFARCGEVFSWRTGKPMKRHSVEDMLAAVLALPAGTRFSVLAPVVRDGAGDHHELLEDLRRQGFARLAVDEVVRDLSSEEVKLDPKVRHTIEVYVDRLVLKDNVRGRLADSVETALRLSGGQLKVVTLDGEELQFSERFADLDHGLAYPELTPGLFSFNSPEGACPECDGLGGKRVFDPRRIVPNEHLSIKEGALSAWTRRAGKTAHAQLQALAEAYGFDLFAPWIDLPEEAKIAIIQGSGTQAVPGLAGKKPAPFEGVIPGLQRRLREAEDKVDDADPDEGGTLDEIAELMAEVTCPMCQGQRLRQEARMVKIGGRNIAELATLPIEQLVPFLDALDLGAETSEVAEAILGQAKQRLKFMLEVGLGYLTLDRTTMTLSGGEAQRIRLATQIGAALVGVTYILDEPSIGLHQRDNDRLIASLLRLRDLGNSVIVVEHDEDTIRAADFLVDMGPGAGSQGGRVVAAGPLQEVLQNKRSLTAAFLTGRMTIPVPEKRRGAVGPALCITRATGHNLKDITVRIPLGALTCVTGVSGSGKSSLVIDTLLPEASRRLNGASSFGLANHGITGLEHLDKVIHVDQSPIGRSPRSNPATYTGLFAELRTLYANLSESKIRGYTPSRFSFNVKGGRCESCQGDGVRRIEMHFLADVYVTCRSCDGRRYNRETLAITYRGKSIADVLAMSVADASEFFANYPNLRRALETLRDVGLGYVTLGQSALTLSGGEAQRIKLAKELAKKSTGKTLFILDEPTTGLHFGDIKQLLKVLERLVDEGNTVVVIEHNLDVIKCADWVVDIGPEGGERGGRLLAAGSPQQVARVKESATGHYLARVLGMA